MSHSEKSDNPYAKQLFLSFLPADVKAGSQIDSLIRAKGFENSLSDSDKQGRTLKLTVESIEGKYVQLKGENNLRFVAEKKKTTGFVSK